MRRSRIVAPVLALCLASLAVAQQSPTCAFQTSPAPAGGTANNAVTSLTQSGFGQGSGPIEYWAFGGAFQASTHTGLAGSPVTLLLGSPQTAAFNLGAAGTLDLSLAAPLFPLYDGFGVFGTPDGSVANLTLPYGLPTGVTAMLASAQGVSVDPTVAGGVRLTARNDIGVQDISAIGQPEQAPFTTNTGITPIAPSVSAIYPYPRDAICPNNGRASSAVGANDGTLFSALGVNFDSTAPGATTVTVNGIAVDLFCVRPNEILFYLTPAHVSLIAGPMVITSTGGVHTPSADQMESWVFCTPANIPVEAPATGYGPGGNNAGVSGTYPTNLNTLRGFIGTKELAGQVDYYDASGLPASTNIRVFSGEYDVASGQIQTQCSGLNATPAATCYLHPANGTGTEPFSQQWFANNNPLADTWLQLGLMVAPGIPAVGTFVADQDDGGPGTDSFAGSSTAANGLGSATVPSLDPDGTWTATGTDGIVNDDFPNPQAGAYPYSYIQLVYFF